jgi:uncharacterized DUF497 family protein
MKNPTFEWDESKNIANQNEHGMFFEKAQYAFLDESRIITHDEKHCAEEERWFCFGRVESCVLTVRFTFRSGTIRIFGAGFWRKGSKYYDQENNSDR